MEQEYLDALKETFFYDKEAEVLYRRFKEHNRPVKPNANCEISFRKKVLYVPKLVWFLNTEYFPAKKEAFGFKNGNSKDFRFSNLVPLYRGGNYAETPERIVPL